MVSFFTFNSEFLLCLWRLTPQVVIFVKNVQRAGALNNLLNDCNFPSVCIHRGMQQDKRLEVYKQFKENQVCGGIEGVYSFTNGCGFHLVAMPAVFDGHCRQLTLCKARRGLFE